MGVHQVITGALNKGENVYAIGSVEGTTFTICAVGSDVVILASDFSRVQIIPGCSYDTEKLVTSVSCCGDSGKIAATYGSLIRVFEPTSVPLDKSRHENVDFPYKWIETHCFTANYFVKSVLWNMDGLRILVIHDEELVLYQHRTVTTFSNRSASAPPVMFCIAEEDQSRSSVTWEKVWSLKLAVTPKYAKYSPDGSFFAIAGENDTIVRIFYQEISSDPDSKQLEFNCVSLHHPTAVCGFEWRRTGRYMPRKCIQAALMTWCADNTSRIWKETPAPELSIIDISGDGGEPAWEQARPRKLFGKEIHVKKTRNKIMNKIKRMVPEKRRKPEDGVKEQGMGLRAQMGRVPSMADLHVAHYAHAHVQFHLASSINAETDCLLVPNMDPNSKIEKTFCVHWLNNKELVFSMGAERLLAEALLNDAEGSNKTASDAPNSPVIDNHSPEKEDPIMENGGLVERATSAMESICSEALSSKDVLDVKLEILLRQWSKASDILFTIHPVDGSLLVWTMEWLDDMNRQPIISFNSRFPGAFPITDATSLQPTVNTFNPHEPVYVDVLKHDIDVKDLALERLLETRSCNTIHLLTNHENGSLNLWHMTMDEKSNFQNILNLTHISRMCGHRFQIHQIVAHPVLPLLLTTSQFKAGWKDHNLDSLSEVILWKIAPVGPLCKSGGVKELARVASESQEAFSSLSWIPTLLPSCTLGTVCNSPSSCFIASDGCNLVIYQAVIDARSLLSEIYESARNQENKSHYEEDSKSLSPSPRKHNTGDILQDFNVVSMQSTAKPGCVLQVGKIEDVITPNTPIHLLHVFNESLVTEKEQESEVTVIRNHMFREKYVVVIVEQGREYDSFVMYSLEISSMPPQPIPQLDVDNLPEEKGFLRPASPLAHSVAKLHFHSELICRQQVPLASGTRVLSASPAAGHLSSSTIYPACQAPYVLITSCDDDVARFWKCEKTDGENRYEWREWNMVSNCRPSELEVEGSIFSTSAAHSGRIACAYDPKSGGELAHAAEVEIGVFECESSGGVEWLREDTLVINNVNLPTIDTVYEDRSPLNGSTMDISRAARFLNSPSEELVAALSRTEKKKVHHNQLSVKEIIRLDWVSTEDGAHILTAGIGSTIYFYTQVSQDLAQQNVMLMKETDTSLRRPSLRKASSLVGHQHSSSRLTKWVCTRVLQLKSADGLPPIPAALCWARDGLLIIGMQSEMRVYNQWNLESKAEETSTNKRRNTNTSVTLTISSSHSMLDQLSKRKELATSKSRLRIDVLNKTNAKESDRESVLNPFSNEGLFEAARLSSPILPQYHPKQLIVLLNAGRTKRVKAILLHVLQSLKQQRDPTRYSISRAGSLRRMSTVEADDGPNEAPRAINIDEDSPDYFEIEDIAPLPLYALMAADTAGQGGNGENAEAFGGAEYDPYYNENNVIDDDIDDIIDIDSNDGSQGVPAGRSRVTSVSSDVAREEYARVIFTAKHNRALTEHLTHTHLPGLSSVDQMHLLAIADTLSHFSSDVMDKLAQANAAMQPCNNSVLSDSAAGGYATAAAGVETLDECGLRYLMAMKQHEYLSICLPPKQRMELKRQGLSSSHIIWAQHSDTESELLNAIPGMQKSTITWDDLRSLGIAWWLKNSASLRICVEKLAKSAFQKNQDPMDASLYYLAMRKKNVVTHLFKTSNNQMMFDFFSNDFTTDHWKMVAAKNAFVLMSKQRFVHAAAFFLLSGSLKDAIQTIINKCNDLQLAMVVIRLYETDMDAQQSFLKDLLCREVLGQTPAEFDASRGNADDETLSKGASRDPFQRSMAFWCLKDYTRASRTLVEEAHGGRVPEKTNLSDIFNFYSFLRKHPLVVRQRLTDAGAQVGSIEKFIAVGRQLENMITPAERRLYFRTAAEHMACGCPMLALEVLSRLPRNLNLARDSAESLKLLLQDNEGPRMTAPIEKAEDFDWGKTEVKVEEEEFKYEWSDDDEEYDEYGDKIEKKPEEPEPAEPEVVEEPVTTTEENTTVDIIAQHMKFVASLRILTEELSTLASGFEVDGGQLRYQIFTWLEKEVEVLKDLCDYHASSENNDFGELDETVSDIGNGSGLHEQLRMDHVEMMSKMAIANRRRKWLNINQKLIRSFTSYCALHSAQSHRLTSALMELLLLLLEIQKDTGVYHLSEAVPDTNSFPLLEASVSSTKMFVSSPLSFIENQCQDLLYTLAGMHNAPDTENNLQKAYMLYNLSQGLSSCLYQSLCDANNFANPGSGAKPGILTKRARTMSGNEDFIISTSPSKWPGVDNLVALLGRERDDDAPQLRLLLVECYTAITMSLFAFALAAYDSRWLYRLSALHMDSKKFSVIFGGGGKKKVKSVPPARPPRPATQRKHNDSESSQTSTDAGNLRSKFHSKIFGAEVNSHASGREQTITRWIPPYKSVVQMFSEKPPIDSSATFGIDFDSDNEEEVVEQDDDDQEEKCEYAAVTSYAWLLLRLALVEQMRHQILQFLTVSGFDITDIASVAPRVDSIFRLLDGWIIQLRQSLRTFSGGCPVDIIPNMTVDNSDAHMGVTARKYASLLEAENTPFESEDARILPVKRLWAFLVREPHLQNLFIAHIYASQSQEEQCLHNADPLLRNLDSQVVPDAFKIVQREQEPIVAFACNQNKPGWLVVSNGRELQEMDISSIFEDGGNNNSWLYNRAELDVQLLQMKRDTGRDNDDYQLFSDNVDNSPKQATMMIKRTVGGIRRIDSHPSASCYVTGSTDGSIRVWEWGVGQPVYTARVAGQHAKVSKISFSCNGNKFAAVDGDGMLCLWQASQATEHKKPFFSHRCHNKYASDVRFLGQTSSVLLTAGSSTGEYNLGLWDTLLPQNRALVHSWVAHPEGATCAMYMPNQQVIVSGGKHGELCLWDVRQRQLRLTIKAFEPNQMIKTLVTDFAQDLIVAGSSEGDIKIWSADPNPQLMYALNGEHTAKGGFSFRQVSQGTIQGVQQLYIDQQMRLFSCGADATLKFRTLPSVYNMRLG